MKIITNIASLSLAVLTGQAAAEQMAHHRHSQNAVVSRSYDGPPNADAGVRVSAPFTNVDAGAPNAYGGVRVHAPFTDVDAGGPSGNGGTHVRVPFVGVDVFVPPKANRAG